MSSEAGSTGYERLHTVLISLGMEISDSILSALRDEVDACRREQQERLAIVGPVLLGIEAVVRHIDEIRALTDARALGLLKELVRAYQEITEEHQGQEGQEAAWTVASEAVEKVFVWQHSCIRENLKTMSKAGSVRSIRSVHTEAVAPATAEPPVTVIDMHDLLSAVRQEIAATGMMAVRESAALLELVHVQKEKRASAPADAVNADEFSSVIRENIFSLEQTLHQEMGRLRHEFIRE